MSDTLIVLLDQNVPREVASWLKKQRPAWRVVHACEVGLAAQPDRVVFDWAQAQRAIVITFDEDFADQRSFPVGHHYGIVRLRVWPTTVEETVNALARLLQETDDGTLSGSLIIVGRARIRIRRAPPT